MGEEADYQIDQMQAVHDDLLDYSMYLGRHFMDEELRDMVKDTKWQSIKQIMACNPLTDNQRAALCNHIAFRIDEYGDEMPVPDVMNYMKKEYWK